MQFIITFPNEIDMVNHKDMYNKRFHLCLFLLEEREKERESERKNADCIKMIRNNMSAVAISYNTMMMMSIKDDGSIRSRTYLMSRPYCTKHNEKMPPLTYGKKQST